MKLTLEQIAKACGGKLVGADMTVTDLVTDSRTVKDGTLFAVIKGERADALDFVAGLDAKFDCAYLTDRAPENVKNPYLLVDDVLTAIGTVARLHLETLAAKRVAVTGSVGKTTTKNFITSALSACMQVNYTKGNRNNELGLPLTALETKETDGAVILEMGMRGKGQITYLCDIAKPDVAVITNVGICHIELLGSRENILDAKWEIVDALGENGIAVINADDDMLMTKKAHCKTITFGIENKNANVTCENINGDSFDIVYKNVRYPALLKAVGRHNIYNALAAFSVGAALGLDKQKLVSGIASFEGDGKRQNIYECRGVTLFDDTYNASPASMEAAMDVFKTLNGDKTLVVADMLELGDLSQKAHEGLVKPILGCNAKRVICIGPLMKYLYDKLSDVEKYHCLSNKDALEILKKTVKKGDCILFKGSNSMNLAKLVNDFEGEWKNDN